MSEKFNDKLLDNVGNIPVGKIIKHFSEINCPISNVIITFLSGDEPHLRLHMKDNGRISLYDQPGNSRMWLPNDQPPNDFQETYSVEWKYRITKYASKKKKLHIVCELPSFAMHNLRGIIESGPPSQTFLVKLIEMKGKEWNQGEDDPNFEGSIWQKIGFDKRLCGRCNARLRDGICPNGCHLVCTCDRPEVD